MILCNKEEPNLKVIFFGVSVRKNQSLFEWRQTRKQYINTYIDIWIDLKKMTLHKKDDFKLASSLSALVFTPNYPNM